MNFKLSGFVYGMGTGIIILSLLYYTVYNFNLSDMLTADKQRSRYENYGLSNTEIEELARSIGMEYPADAYVMIDIPEGFEINDLAEILKNNELIVSADEFSAFVTEKNAIENIKSGEYRIKKTWSFDEILNEISVPAA